MAESAKYMLSRPLLLTLGAAVSPAAVGVVAIALPLGLSWTVWLPIVAAIILCALLRLQRFRSYDPQLCSPLPAGVTTAAGVADFLASRDEVAAPLNENAGSSVRWADGHGVQTKLAVVYIHGWSASPREINPVDARVAEELNANLLRYRLTGHGMLPLDRAGPAMRDTATRDALLRDVATAYACAKLLGKRVVLIGGSTGASLSMWLACQPWADAKQHLAAVVSISPAFSLLAPSATVYSALKWLVALAPTPVAKKVVEVAVGTVHTVKVPEHSDPVEFGRVWTLAYPKVAAVNAVEVYLTLELSVDVATMATPNLIFAHPDDPIASYKATIEQVRRMPDCRLEVVTDSEMPHVLTGNIVSPSTVDRCVATTLSYIRDKEKDRDEGGAAAVSISPGQQGKQRVSRSPARSPGITATWPR